MQTLPLASVLVEDRIRKDLDLDSDGLLTSIKRYGILSPLLLRREDNRLIAGERRFRCAEKIGLSEVPVVYRDQLTERQLTILELEENIRRKAMTWKEETLAVYKVHRLKSDEAALEGDSWPQEQTGRLLGMSRANVGFMLQVAKELQDQSSRIHECDTFSDAIRWCMRRNEDLIQADLARDLQAKLNSARASSPTTQPSTTTSALEIVEAVEDREKATFDLTSTIILSDSIKWMSAQPPGLVDHILTDPPYGIDMKMINQTNPHGGLIDLDRVEETHQVDPNLDLLASFFPLAFRILKEKGFCVLFCDTMNWQFLYDHATEAGFIVQHWPFIWQKTHPCMNQRAEFNMTKNFELAMICRKRGTTLVKPVQSSIFACSSQGYISNPFAKPFDLWAHLIEAISIKGQLILDPFAGEGSSSTTVISCWRFPIAVECDEKHYNVLLDEVKKKYDLLYRKPNYI